MKRSWSAREWLPNAATLTLIGVTTTPASVVVEADGPASARCPACDRLSQTRHSRYWRTLKDLAAQGRSVTLRVHVSRWRCGNSQCDTVLFADRLADSHRVGGEFPIATQETFNEPQRGIFTGPIQGAPSALVSLGSVEYGRAYSDDNVASSGGAPRITRRLTRLSASDTVRHSAAAIDANGGSRGARPRLESTRAGAPPATREPDSHCSNAETREASSPDRQPSRRASGPGIRVGWCQSVARRRDARAARTASS